MRGGSSSPLYKYCYEYGLVSITSTSITTSIAWLAYRVANTVVDENNYGRVDLSFLRAPYGGQGICMAKEALSINMAYSRV